MDDDFGDNFVAKSEDVFRLTTGNANGFDTHAVNNARAAAISSFCREAESDFHCMQEVGINWSRMERRGQLKELFRTETLLRCSAAHNKHGHHGLRQWGGTAAMTFGDAAARVSETGVDPSGLGRWAWISFKGRNNFRTRIISAYRPCRSSQQALGSVYSQHKRRFRALQRPGCPRQLFIDDLKAELTRWRANGERLIVCVDGNENVRKGPLYDMFTDPSLGMREVMSTRHANLPVTPTFCAGGRMGSVPIDGVWVTPDLTEERATWLAIGKGPGDHRYGIVDIKWTTLLGEDIFKIKRPNARRLSTSNYESQKNYQRVLERQYRQHRLLPKMYQLYPTLVPPLATTLRPRMEGIDRPKSDAMRHAEKKCRRKMMGVVPFSPEVTLWDHRAKLWKYVKERRQGYRRSSSYIRILAKKAKIQCPLSVTLAQATANHEEALQEWRTLKKGAPELRISFLKEKINDPRAHAKKVAAAKRMLRREEARADSGRINYALEKQRAGAISKVEVVSPNGVVIYNSQDEVEAAVMHNNEARFRLTEDTPFMQEPLREEVGFLGATEAAQQMLAGTYVCPPGTDEFTQHFVDCLKQATWTSDDRIHTRITKEDYCNYWNKAREATSSSYSGLHFSHHKVAAKNPYLAEVNAFAVELAYASGYSYERWQAGLSAMLEKKAGVIRVDKLRAILLMEADFNFANKLIFGSRMVHTATRNGEIPPELFGSLQGKEAIEVAIGRRLTADLSRQRRTPLAMSSVDAQTCYDRMVHSVTSICCQRWRVPIWAITSMLTSIQLMKFYIRTGFGDSETYYGGGDGPVPFQGGCQGNGAAPALWLSISAILVMTLKRLGTTTKFRSALSATKTKFIGFLFVDDTDLINLANDPETPAQDVAASMQDNVTIWYKSLQHSGGALHPDKSSWCLLAYRWLDTGAWAFHTKETMQADIEMPDLAGNMKTITRHEPMIATTAVGVVQALDGSMQAQVAVSKEKADTWAKSIQAKWLPRKLAWTALRQFIWASIRYPLAATNFSKKQADSILTKLYKLMLPGLGICRNVKKCLRHAPKMLFGFHLPSVWVEQGIAQLKYFLTHAHCQSLLGTLYRASLEQAILEVGVGRNLFDLPFDEYGFLMTDNCLIKSIWEFVSGTESMTLTGPMELPKLQRQGDVFLMEELVNRRALTERELIGFNRVRIHLEVITLADITSGDGKRIEVWAQTMRKLPEHKSKWHWAKEVPGRVDRRAWKKGLEELKVPGMLNLPLSLKLGNWIADTHREIWVWYYVPETRTLYRNSFGSWLQYRPVFSAPVRQGTNFRLHSVGPPPAHAQRATAQDTTLARVRFGGSAMNLATPPVVTMTLAHILRSMDHNWPLEYSTFPNEGLDIAIAIMQNRAHGVCDGSYMPTRAPHLGGAAWILEDASRVTSADQAAEGSCQGTVRVSGSEDDVNPYRAESQGVHAQLMALKAICFRHNIQQGSARLGCDNETCVGLADKDFTRVTYTKKHVDLLRAIRSIKAELPIKVSYEHVRGHQDDTEDITELPRLAQLNVLMDRAAKDHLLWLIQEDEASPDGLPACSSDIHGEGWSLRFYDEFKPTGDITEVVHFATSAPEMQAYLHEKDLVHHDDFYHVDWRAVDDAMEGMPALFRLWACKHVHNYCGVGYRMAKWKFWENDLCPCCKMTTETTRHIATCPDVRLREAWAEQLEGFHTWLVDSDTHPDIITCIVETLRNRNEHTSFTIYASEDVMEAAEDQDCIGWHNLTEGRISRRWREIQADHYHYLGSKRTAKRWASGLVTNLLELTHSSWKARNNIVHEKARNGLLVTEAAELEERIRAEFGLGTEGLSADDKWLLQELGLDEVLSKSGNYQHHWLEDVTNARDEFTRNDTIAMDQMRTAMHSFTQPMES